MKHPGATLTIAVTLAFYWTLPPRAFPTTPRFDHPVMMAMVGPYDQWFMATEPLQLSITDRRSAPRTDRTAQAVRPAWISFAIVASWSAMMIVDRSDPTALVTCRLIHVANPMMFLATTMFVGTALRNGGALPEDQSPIPRSAD